MGHRYASSEPNSDGLALGSRLQWPSLCLPPGGGERENASVLGFRWHRLERRYSNSERRYVGPTRGSTLGRWYYCPHQGYGDNGSLWYTYSPDGTNWGEDTLVQNVGMK